MIKTLKTVKQEIRNFLNDAKAISPVRLNHEEAVILDSIKEKGFYIIPNFYTSEKCAELRTEIDRLIEKYGQQMFRDKENSDHRIHGADRLSPIIEKFYTDKLINNIIQAHEKTTDINGFTMAARLEYKPGNLGSGGGWHRDWAVDKQIKAILYLSDVNEETGPFQYLEGSHRHWDIIKDCQVGHFDFNQNRFSDEEIDNLVKKKDSSKLHTITGKAGILLLANTRGIHRGMPIQKGNRYALTNYYWSDMPIPSHLEKMMIKK